MAKLGDNLIALLTGRSLQQHIRDLPLDRVENPGYHRYEIHKGELGDLTKVVEEVCEMVDAAHQGNKVMVLVELADLVGAIQAYLDRHHKGLRVYDLQTMAEATKRAFAEGYRK